MLATHTPPTSSAFALDPHAADHRREAISCTVDYITALASAVRLALDELHSEFPGARERLNLATSMLNLIGDQAVAAILALEISARETVQ